MACLYPFPGLRFNPSLITDLSSILCPPYDIISPEQQTYYYDLHPYNVIRLELAKPEVDDNPYTSAAVTLERWLETNILVREDSPAFYFHEHTFIYEGKRLKRLGILAAVDVERSPVYPHEDTLKGPKEDRLKLLRACRTYISPIFTLYSDPGGKVLSWIAEYTVCHPPVLTISGDEGHRLWIVRENDAIAKIQEFFLPLHLYIADGHHRFETALAYSKEEPNASAALMELVSVNDPGLRMLTVHRLVTGISGEAFFHLMEELREDFEVYETMPARLTDLARAGQLNLAVFFGGAGFWLKPVSNTTSLPTSLHLLHQAILPRIARIASDYRLEYSTDTAELLHRSAAGEGIAFLVPALSPGDLLKLAQSGIRLPGKATYFYPKLPTGLVLYCVKA